MRRTGASVTVTWEDVRRPVSLYAGDLGALRTTGYTHEATTACRVLGASADVLLVPSEAYVLVVVSECASPSLEGPAGFDSVGRARPLASALGRPACP